MSISLEIIDDISEIETIAEWETQSGRLLAFEKTMVPLVGEK